MEENFRSSEGIVETARALVEQNGDRPECAPCNSASRGGEPVKCSRFSTTGGSTRSPTAMRDSERLTGRIVGACAWSSAKHYLQW